MVKKLTVEIPDDLNEQLNYIARMKGVTKQDLISQILSAYINGSVVTEDTLENTNAKCIWEGLKILKALMNVELEMEEKRLAMEMRLKRRYLLGELAHASTLAKALAKYAERLKSPKDMSKEEEKKLGEILETFLYGMAARMGLLPEEWVGVEETQPQQPQQQTEAEEEEEEETEAQ